MKKIVGLSILALSFVACKPTLNTKAQTALKGDWTLTSVTYPKGYNVKPFGIADAACFENSMWKLVPNNNKGVISVNGGQNCLVFDANIVWTIDENNNFNLKFVGEEKPKHVKDGYIFTIQNQTDNSFRLVDNSTEIQIEYHFIKNN